MRILFIAAVFALCAFGHPALAQDSDADVRAALAERLINATSRANIEKTMTDSMDRQIEASTTLNDAQRAWYAENLLPILLPHLEAMVDDMETRYAEAFTVSELQALVAFYETSEGRVIAQKQSLLGAEIGSHMGTFMRAYMTDLRQKYCASFDCPGQEPDAARSKGS